MLCYVPQTSWDPNGVTCGLHRAYRAPSGQESLDSTRSQVQLLPIGELRHSHSVLQHEQGRTNKAAVALFRLRSLQLRLPQSQLAPPTHGLLSSCLGYVPGRSLWFQLRSLWFQLRTLGVQLRSLGDPIHSRFLLSLSKQLALSEKPRPFRSCGRSNDIVFGDMLRSNAIIDGLVERCDGV